MQHPTQNNMQEIAEHVAGWTAYYLQVVLKVPEKIANQAGAVAGLHAVRGMTSSIVESMRGRV